MSTDRPPARRSFARILVTAALGSAAVTLLLRWATPIPDELIAIVAGLGAGLFAGIAYWRAMPVDDPPARG